MNNRLRILVIAHELSPYSGSECAVGWNLVTRLAGYHDITVLHASGSQARPFGYQHALLKYFDENPPVPGLELISVNQPRFTRLISFINKAFSKIGPIGLPVLYYLGYRAWQKCAYRKAQSLHQRSAFNAVHQITQITYREPGYTWKMGIPFFWGPTGGVANMPWEFYKGLSLSSGIIEGIRFVSNKYQSACMKRIKKAIAGSAYIYTYSKEDLQFFSKSSAGVIRQMLDVGTIVAHNNLNDNSDHNTILNGVWCGQLTYRKAPEIAIMALASGNLTRDMISLTIIGEGPMEKRLRDLADRHQLNNVRWIKRIPHQQVFEIMKKADFLIHTSLREATSSVIPEALSAGLPVICHDSNGMGIAINETCGIKVPLISPVASIRGFHEAMKSLVLDHNSLVRLKKGALIRAGDLTWDNMAKTIAYDYWRVMGDGENIIAH